MKKMVISSGDENCKISFLIIFHNAGQFRVDLPSNAMLDNGSKKQPKTGKNENANAPGNFEQLKKLNTFGFINEIQHGPNPDVDRIRAKMGKEKVPHQLFGSLWKVKRQWKDGEFEQELDARNEAEKEKMYRENVGKKLLLHYSYPIEAVADKLLDIVWDSADIKRIVEVSITV
jgi:hypothetical protein